MEATSNTFAGVTITPYRDGPYLVRGAFRLLDQDGREISPGRRTVALCRCGKSRMRPFCDGTHRLIGFRAPGADERAAADEAGDEAGDEADAYASHDMGALGQATTL